MKLGVLTRTFELERKHYFVPTVMVLCEIGPDRRLRPDVEAWQISAADLGREAVLDECMPKQRGEILVHGRCFTAGAVPRPAAAARVKVGSIDKTLYVIGDRTWRRDGTASDPEPFTEMPITYTRAFGGEGFQFNPIGVGVAPTKEGGREVHKLPNIEFPKKLIKSRSDKPMPAGFGPYDLLWAQRWPKLGTYDARWLREELPGLARDIDLSMWNAAPDDQQLQAGYFEGTEEILIENMHPEKPRLEGRLPGVIGRCFVTQREDGAEVFKEIPLHLDTVQLFPHRERCLLSFRGLIHTSEDDADDIVYILIAADDMAAPRPIEHYRAVLERRLDPKREATEAFRDSDLVPPNVGEARAGGGEIDTMFDLTRSENILEKNLAERARLETERARASVLEAGGDPSKIEAFEPTSPSLIQAPTFDSLPDFIEKSTLELEATQRTADEKKKRVEDDTRKRYAAAGMDYDAMVRKMKQESAGPPKFSADKELERLRDIQTLCRNASVEAPELDRVLADPETETSLRNSEARAIEAYRLGAHLAEYRPERITEPARSEIRRRVAAAYAEGQSFAMMDLCGADLSEMNLKGIDLSGAFLENAILTGTNLAGARMARAVLSAADLSGADLTEADLTEANLGAARLLRAKLDGASLKSAIFSKSDFTGASFSGVTLELADLSEAIFDGANLSRVKLSKCILKGNQLRGCDFRESTLSHAVLDEVDLRSANFANATMEHVTLLRSTLDDTCFLKADLRGMRLGAPCTFIGADLRGALIEGATLREADFSRADFSGATLISSDLSKCILREANLYRAVAKNALFIRADLTGASLIAANLEGALFQKAKLARADFKGANLFRADLLRAVGDDRTSFEDANVRHVRVSPKENGDPRLVTVDPAARAGQPKDQPSAKDQPSVKETGG
jgi:uncharacterized protein YjbI with pentapeptide repeats